ncbi:MAG: hypothetical protein RLZZ09_3197 [Pseudomonadota bacterium]|jgi:type VI protein secretion system component Hcp
MDELAKSPIATPYMVGVDLVFERAEINFAFLSTFIYSQTHTNFQFHHKSHKKTCLLLSSLAIFTTDITVNYKSLFKKSLIGIGLLATPLLVSAEPFLMACFSKGVAPNPDRVRYYPASVRLYIEGTINQWGCFKLESTSWSVERPTNPVEFQSGAQGLAKFNDFKFTKLPGRSSGDLLLATLIPPQGLEVRIVEFIPVPVEGGGSAFPNLPKMEIKLSGAFLTSIQSSFDYKKDGLVETGSLSFSRISMTVRDWDPEKVGKPRSTFNACFDLAQYRTCPD